MQGLVKENMLETEYVLNYIWYGLKCLRKFDLNEIFKFNCSVKNSRSFSYKSRNHTLN